MSNPENWEPWLTLLIITAWRNMEGEDYSRDKCGGAFESMLCVRMWLYYLNDVRGKVRMRELS
jgi:hypothetical protein